MSKNKTEDLLSKIMSRKQKEAEEQEKAVIDETLPYKAFDVHRMPGKGNNFQLVVIRYNPTTKVAVVDSVHDANDNKVVAMRYCDIEKKAMETLFLTKAKRGEK